MRVTAVVGCVLFALAACGHATRSPDEGAAAAASSAGVSGAGTSAAGGSGPTMGAIVTAGAAMMPPQSTAGTPATNGAGTTSQRGDEPTAGGAAGAGGEAGTPHEACAGVAPTCGPLANADCCHSDLISGGVFNRGNDATMPATVAAFRLDTYEITVGRFRQFVDAYPASRPVSGSGANPNNPADTGWDESWPLPVDQAALLKALKCGEQNLTWSEQPSTFENFPMNCVSWYEAFAFCIWDGGRMPTEAEWNFAAAGGAEQRVYPWSNPPSSTEIDANHAFYEGSYKDKPLAVGSKSPQGDGKWGSADLAGNLWEWTHDAIDPYPVPCDNCSSTPAAEDPNRDLRGGGIYHSSFSLTTSTRSNAWASQHYGDIGARCARDP